MEMTLKNLRNGYVDVLRAVMDRGEVSSPRGEPTKEVLGAVLHIEDPIDTLPIGVGRKASPKLAAIEALQLVGGYSDVEQCKRVSPHLAHFEDLGRFHGAYGPRVLPQLRHALRRISQDKETRRAVINVWDPVQDLLVDGVKNYPCTTQLQFMVRGGKLDLFVTMRANDAWKGLAYDAFTFAQLQATAANALGLPLGTYHHYATSLHVYESEWRKVKDLDYGDSSPKPASGFGPFLSEGGHWTDIDYGVYRAREIGAGTPPDQLNFIPTTSEAWYMDTLSGLL